MTPDYIPNFIPPRITGFEELNSTTPWLSVAETREECFMSGWDKPPGCPFVPLSYTYGSGRGVRTYTSVPVSSAVRYCVSAVCEYLYQTEEGYADPAEHMEQNVCFLNKYRNEQDMLGFHADDHPGTDHTRPICVLSFGQAREIWIRPNGTTGVVPPENRFLLASGSLFIMPPGMQQTHQHRIPKGDRVMGPRISLTFRKFML